MLSGFQQANFSAGFGKFVGSHTPACTRTDNDNVVGIGREIKLGVLHSGKIIR
jgi:hypothetical protein